MKTTEASFRQMQATKTDGSGNGHSTFDGMSPRNSERQDAIELLVFGRSLSCAVTFASFGNRARCAFVYRMLTQGGEHGTERVGESAWLS